MFLGTVIGRVTANLEVQKSAEQSPYIRFTLAVNKYGKNKHTLFLQCWIFGKENVDRIIKAKVGKGSLIQIAGDIDLVEYKKKRSDGPDTTGMVLKIIIWSWSYVSADKVKTPEEHNSDALTKSPMSLEDFDVISE